MKLKEGFVIRHLGEDDIAVYTGGDAVDLINTVVLNKTARLLFEAMYCEVDRADLLHLLCASYDISQERAGQDVDEFVNMLSQKGFLE